ncbi:hypothetical protein ERX37_03125 [Macrococcus hajekii]|uniref:Uncharacterized protein n=1 Tax=Macrococcus hajekii TaxID=198482 RepID=A0A4R6BMU3_9STAP|nr:hypothetical protein [Macrococcus hajekii]TDM03091.1 hypothetical protein ERX37_03125 [Macrococcus hajekii]GGB06447.1 hypothetical protein GCM10007190_13180 [Macrococcus hajekii]
MTIRLSKDFLMYLFFFLMMGTFGIIYMAQSNALYEKPLVNSVGQSTNTENTTVQNTNAHSATMNGEVLGIVR